MASRCKEAQNPQTSKQASKEASQTNISVSSISMWECCCSPRHDQRVSHNPCGMSNQFHVRGWGAEVPTTTSNITTFKTSVRLPRHPRVRVGHSINLLLHLEFGRRQAHLSSEEHGKLMAMGSSGNSRSTVAERGRTDFQYWRGGP